MTKISATGIDLSKNVFELHSVNRVGKKVRRSKVSRARMTQALSELPSGSTVYLESGQGSHHWARQAESLGLVAKQIPPQFVQPFRKSQKNDPNDAEAAVEAGCRPSMRFVSTKTIAQQEVEAVLVIRTRLIKERTALLNQSRGLLAEQGKALRQGPSTIKRYLKIELLNDTGITPFLRELLGEMQEHLQCLEVQLARQEVRIKQFAQRDAAVRRLMSIPGLGTLSAVALSVCCGNVKAFKNGRQFAAWLGLVPRQFSSGGKAKLSGITKRGDSFMRTLLIHGARAVIRFVKGKTDRYSLWVQKLLATKGTRITAVALANKNARIAWRLLTSEQVFDAAFQLAA